MNVIASLLLIIVSLLSLLSNSDIVVRSGMSVIFPYQMIDGTITFEGKEPYSLPLEWYVKGLTNKLLPIIIFFLIPMKTDFPKWILAMWLCYFALIAVDWVLFFERWPWRYTVDLFVCSVQIGYVCYESIVEK